MRKAARFLKAIYRRPLQVREIPDYYLNCSYSGAHVFGYTQYPKGREYKEKVYSVFKTPTQHTCGVSKTNENLTNGLKITIHQRFFFFF